MHYNLADSAVLHYISGRFCNTIINSILYIVSIYVNHCTPLLNYKTSILRFFTSGINNQESAQTINYLYTDIIFIKDKLKFLIKLPQTSLK